MTGRVLVGALVNTLDALRRDRALRLVVLTGPRGGSFQSGVNIAEMPKRLITELPATVAKTPAAPAPRKPLNLAIETT